MKTNILTNNTIMKTHQSIFKSILMVALMLTIGVGQIWGTDVTIKFGSDQGEGYVTTTSGNIDDNLAYSTFKGSGETTAPTVYDDGLRLYHKNNATTEGGVLRIYVRTGQSCTINSVVVTYSTGKLGYIASAHTYGEALSSVTKYNATASPVTISDIDDTSIHLSNANSNTTQTRIQTVEISYSCEGDEDECTPGVASGIKAGDVVLIYYPSASKEFGGYAESGASHWGDVHTYTTNPSGYYPFTVEAGSASGYWSFKNGSTYLAMSEGNANKLVGSGTKNDASSWSVSINGSTKEATITNKANSTYLLKYNTNSPRFSSYLSSAGNTALPKIYKYCGDVKYYVTYYGNENTGGSVPTDATAYTSGDKATVLGNTGALAKTGSTFAGWNTKADGTGTSYAAGDKITMSGSVSLYAKWNSRMDVASVGHVTITATPAGASAVAESSYANVDCGKTVSLSQSSVESGYTFSSWKVYKTGDESTTITVTSNSFVMPAFPVTVSAVITPPYIYFTSCSSVLTVTYNANGGTGNVPVDANEYAKNDNVTVLGNVGTPSTLSKDGYTFGGWQAGGVGDVYEAGDSYTITSNTTFYAVWTPNNYKITSISTNPASSGTVTATYNAATVVAGTTEIPCGSEVTLSQEANRDKTFTSWTIKNASTSADVTATYLDGNTLTMPPFNCTVTANYSAKSSCVVTFSLQSGTISTTTIDGQDYTTDVTLYDGESITTLPTVGSIDCGDWGTVVGWTTNSSYSESSTPPTYITAPYNPGSNTTVYAVYRKTAGSADFDGTNDGTYYVLSKTYYASSCFSGFSDETTTTTSQASATPFTFTKNGDYYNISCSEGYYIQYSYGVTDNPNSDAAKWTPVKANENGGAYTSGTEYWYFTNKGTTNRAFAFTTNSRNRFMESVSVGNITDESKVYYPMQLISASTSYYSINPVCGTTYTITKGTCTPASSVLDEDDEYCDFSLSTTSVSSGGMVTVTLTPNKDYTYNASTVTISGGGSASIGNITETAGVITCNITGITADMTVNVTYVAKPLYTVTLYDNGTKRGELTEEHFGAGVTLPSGNNCGVGSAFTFEGWTESAVELNADPVRPATLHAAGSYVPTSDITLYSVYSKSVAGCDDFAAGVSGAYKMYYDGSTYATTAGGSGNYTGATSGTAEVFYIAYAPAHTGYTIRTSTGFVGWNYDGSVLTKANATPYYWKISGSSSNWVITPEPSAYTKQLKSTNGSTFQLYAAGTSGKLLLQKSAMTYYYNTAICEGAQITFHDGGGTISGTPTTPTGASWNSGTHVLSGLEDCDKITTFPTANYDGWTFIGWSTEDYSNSGKHTADHAEENASTDEPDGSIIYKTGGNPYVVRGGSIDLYPVFTRFPDNEPFNTESGGDYYIYYLKPGTDDGYGANIRVYAGEYDGQKRYSQTTSCAAATEFTFTKDGDIWHIYDKTTSKYVAGLSGEDWLLHANDLSGTLDDWTLTIKSGNQFYASCQGGGRYITFSTSANYFMDYSTSANPGICLPVYLGSCTERIFSSEPNPTPTIDLTGEPMVTSSKGQTVRAAIPMTLSASHITGTSPLKVTITGTNLKFATSAAVNTDPAASLEVAVDGSGKIDPTTIYVYYTPTEDEDGIENIIVTAVATKWGPTEIKRTTGIVHARHLPEDFVIATKLGDKWYALPANCTTNSSSTEGMLIEVDDVNDPTAATAAPASTKYGLRNVAPKTRKAGHGERMVFTERISTATADNQKTLYNGSSTNIQVNAMYTTYKDNDTEATREKYEWTPETSDFKDYLLTSASASRTLSMNTSGVFGSLTQDKAYSGQVRLLPATFYTPADMQVVEWKANRVVVMYTGSGVTATTKVGTNSESSAQTLTTAKVDHGVFELTTDQALTSNTNTQLLITIKNGSSAVVGKKALVIPAIINTDNKTADYVVSGADAAERIAKAATTDVVILGGAVLSAVATKYTYKNITVYPGGKLVIGSGKQLGMASLTLRGGSSWGAAEYEHKYPQFVLNNATDGAYSNTAVKINYDYVTTKAQYYTFVLPYTGNTSTIKYPVDIYGKNLDSGSQASFEFQYYDGEARAAGGTGWATLAEPADLVAGRGYTFLGMPRKVDAYDGTDNSHSNTRQTYGIHRIPMSVAASAVQNGENNSDPGKATPISVILASKNNDSGWNLVGNPYMSNVSGLSNTDIQVGKLVHVNDAGGNWTGRWQWDDSNPTTGVRYIVTTDDGQTFESQQASTATLKAFKNFFVQIQNEGANTLVIPADSRTDKLLAPARYMDEVEQDIQLAVDLVSEARKDKVDLLINDIYTAEFDQDGDFTKMMNSTNFNLYGVYPGDNLSFIAVDKTTAANSIAVGYQVPAGGDYTLQLSDREYVMTDAIEALYVTDHEVSPEVTTDLLDGPYNFHVNNAETNDTRFTISIRLVPKTPTDLEIVPGEGMEDMKPQKFIYHDKMYILRGGVIYDTTGKKVGEINK